MKVGVMGDEFGRLAYLVLLLVAIGGFVLVEFRQRPGQASRQMLAWVLIFVGVVAAAGLWEDFSNRAAPRQQVLEGGRIEIPRSRDGHYHLAAELNGATVRFVVDTGATTIALSRRDAERIGIDTDGLAYIGQARTANGLVQTAPVMIDSFRIGEIADDRVMAVVINGEMELSLLGMTYLSRFARVSMEADRLLLER